MCNPRETTPAPRPKSGLEAALMNACVLGIPIMCVETSPKTSSRQCLESRHSSYTKRDSGDGLAPTGALAVPSRGLRLLISYVDPCGTWLLSPGLLAPGQIVHQVSEPRTVSGVALQLLPSQKPSKGWGAQQC